MRGLGKLWDSSYLTWFAEASSSFRAAKLAENSSLTKELWEIIRTCRAGNTRFCIPVRAERLLCDKSSVCRLDAALSPLPSPAFKESIRL